MPNWASVNNSLHRAGGFLAVCPFEVYSRFFQEGGNGFSSETRRRKPAVGFIAKSLLLLRKINFLGGNENV
ncbi:hypothetical protein CLOLEP_01060 [[Clostridium] leptum DSM 753]|uniref:Uncharacterized protein n=1 Tax=[Clostridium] leptum DSM 753 TaxID=428125 RepID=A7VR77_9FIRM|nr:hypothetical protein CLOLEP_01060 [[Clostridium] leptum DSM 753]